MLLAGRRRRTLGPLFVLTLAVPLTTLPAAVSAQVTRADYVRAASLSARYDGLVTGVVDQVQWVGDTRQFVFRRSVQGGHEHVLMDAATLEQRTLSDDERRSILSSSSPVASPAGGPAAGTAAARASGGIASPDGRLEAFVQNYNLHVRAPAESAGNGPAGATALSSDGSEGNHYTPRSIRWSPDSRRLVAYRVVPGYDRQVHYIDSSPDDQLQPRHSSRTYLKPGDVLAIERPVLFDVASGTQIEIDNALFPNAYGISNIEWRQDGRSFTFEYNQRGHDVYRIIEVDAATGAARAVISEQPETFFYYRPSSQSGKRFRHDVDAGREIIWMSERDGWNHLYLFDGRTGRVKNRITTGEWVVRDVQHVDERRRQIWFSASGRHADQDPYFVHYYRINFDGSGLVALTDADGNHDVSYSPEMQYAVVTWSRIDMPPITQLRRAGDGHVLAELGRGDHSALLAAGWQPPEVFTAKGRDGETDIWGMIIRPSNFDPSKTYPVVEYIYAGPHSSHVPKSFTVLPSRTIRETAEIGFIVVQIDGMGTSNRSKAFHDVAWKNLGDAGFPDRILWHRAVAARYAYYDTTRVGIYGHSAGGQNALGALLFHPEFYHVASAANGCHDNRMDKIWWNELWMSWPLGPHYAASSNVEHAHRLQGRLQLVVSELDTNVDPASTYQVVDALIAADKDFDLLVLTGQNHQPGGAYGDRKRWDFLVRHLHGVEPPAWNASTSQVNGSAQRP
jgi:dipeptidyl aminopeptidase/acylaminoacyl peptidase